MNIESLLIYLVSIYLFIFINVYRFWKTYLVYFVKFIIISFFGAIVNVWVFFNFGF